MFPTLASAVCCEAEFQNELPRRFRNHIIQQDPRIQRLFECHERNKKLPFCWGLYLSAQDCPKQFQFIELGATGYQNMAQIHYYATLLGKICTAGAVGVTSESQIPFLKSFQDLGIQAQPVTFLDAQRPQESNILLVHSEIPNMDAWIQKLSETGIMIFQKDLWISFSNSRKEEINREFLELFEVSGYVFLIPRSKIE
jgi:hypothetical protein